MSVHSKDKSSGKHAFWTFRTNATLKLENIQNLQEKKKSSISYIWETRFGPPVPVLPGPDGGFTRKQSNPSEGQRGVGSQERSRTAQATSAYVLAPYYSHLCNALETQIFWKKQNTHTQKKGSVILFRATSCCFLKKTTELLYARCKPDIAKLSYI